MLATAQLDKKIGIVGLSKKGAVVYSSLKKIELMLVCYDDQDKFKSQFLETHPEAHISHYSEEEWQQLDRIVICANLPRRHPVFGFAKKHDIEVVSDLQIFLDQVPTAKLIGITGTNGKSTTLGLINHVISKTQSEFKVGGINNTPLLDLDDCGEGYIFDISSYQLDLLDNFEPYASILLNVEPGQLGRYANYQDYSKSKEKIISLSSKSTSIIGIDSVFARNLYMKYVNLGCENLLPISGINEADSGVYCSGNSIVDNYFNLETIDKVSFANCIVGMHNRQNIAAAYTICKLINIDSTTIVSAFKDFEGLPHRMQFVSKWQSKDGKHINFYNNSKAINMSAAAISLGTIENIYWLAGGKLKDVSMDRVLACLKNVRKAYLYGQDAKKIASGLRARVKFEIFTDIETALKAACAESYNSNLEQANILLSPGCHSTDQFASYEERGEKFIEIANKLIRASEIKEKRQF